MAKCLNCNGCVHYRWVDDERLLYCDFCYRYFRVDEKNNRIVDVTNEITNRDPKVRKPIKFYNAGSV